MSASASIAAALATLVPAPTGTANDTRQALDASTVINAGTDTIAQISIMPDDGITGDDQLVEIQLLAASKAVTPDHTAEEFTCAAHGYAEGQPVQLDGTAAPAGLALAAPYYIKYTGVNAFQLAASVGAAALPFTDNGTAVTVRAFGRAALSYQYPNVGPAAPVQIKDMVNGTPDDWTKIRALQIILRPLNAAANALGSVQLTAGDTSERYGHFNVPLHLDYTAAGEDRWPSWTAALPQGFNYDTAWHLTCRTKSGESNANCLILINLLGN